VIIQSKICRSGKIVLLLFVLSLFGCEGLFNIEKKNSIHVTGVSLSQEQISISVGEKVTIVPIISPKDATNPAVFWITSDSNIASVDQTGMVTANSAGAATITVTTEEGEFSAGSEIAVTNATIAVSGIMLSPSTVNLSVGESFEFTAVLSPSDASNKNISWSSSNSDIASVDGTGIVTANAAGAATITVTTEEGAYMADSEITVIENQRASCVVSFNSMGGASLDDLEVQIGETFSEPAEPTLENYIFSGWFRDDYYNSKWVFEEDIVEEDTILYAKWTEIFSAENKPSSEILTCSFINDDGEIVLTGDGETIDRTYKLQTPWNYEKEYNSERLYPLVISLHGWTTLTDHYSDPASFCGSTNMREYPCFFFAPNNAWTEDCPISDWDDDNAAWVRNIIGQLIADYRIDTDRIYILGFSMGGSGSYYLAEDLYDDGIEIAGIIRNAGMSYSDLPLEIIEKTSVWYNVGLNDDDTIRNVADDAYEYMKNSSYFIDAVETVEFDNMGGYDRKTSTLTVNGIEAMKLSQYTGLGHSSVPVWQDPFTLKWLFHQSLKDR